MIDLGRVLERADRPALVADVGRVLLDDLGLEGVAAAEIEAEIGRLAALLSPPVGRKLDRPASDAEAAPPGGPSA
jgi:hypothetical protein